MIPPFMRGYFNKLTLKFKHMNRSLRITVGILLVIGGLLGFLPIVGFWMLPIGLLALSYDFKWARKYYLIVMMQIRKWKHRHLKKKNAKQIKK